MIEPTPYFEVNLTGVDGQRIPPQQFRTVHDAMTAAEGYENVAGAINFYLEPGADPVPVIIYNADGTIDAGPTIPDDDEDEPWTDAEIEANFAAGRTPTAAERERFGITD